MKKANVVYILSFLFLGCMQTSNPSKASDNTTSSNTEEDISKSPQNETNNKSMSTCQLEFYGASSTLSRYTITQVISFDPTNSDCWKALEQHGLEFCMDRFPCRILFIESDKLGSEKSDPTMPNFGELKKVGIADYTKFTNGWQLSGANASGWERKGDGYDYFKQHR